MVEKRIAVCGNCLCRLGITFERGAQIPRLYCAACEPSMTHKEEMREADERRYKAALNSI